MKKTILLFFYFFVALSFGQVPEYYASVNFNGPPETIKNQLSNLITFTHQTFLVYTPETWVAIKMTDLDPTDNTKVLLVYGYNDNDQETFNDRTRSVDANCTTSSCIGLWNREHVFARSLGQPNLGFEFAGSDVHNLRASDSQMNSARSNRKFAQGSGNSGTIGSDFYPGDEWKGDIARMIMYMYVRYQSQCLPTNVGAGSTALSPLGDMPDIFLQWNAEDPVSLYEMNRNNILEQWQGNRNPFIDNPYIATLIWSGPTAQDNWNLLSITQSTWDTVTVYPTITSDQVYVTNSTGMDIKYEVNSTVGQQVKSGQTTDQIDLSTLPSGMYIIRLEQNQLQKVVKVIKR